MTATTSELLAADLPADFSESTITGAITAGTAMEFAPDGKLYVLEQMGTMEVYQGSGGGLWTQVAPSGNFFTGDPLVVDSAGERGLLGIAFDPNFTSNRFLYVYYTTEEPTTHNRISRFTANAAGTQVVAGSEAIIMDLDDLSGATNHNGGAMHFGPDGKLYVAVGENANPSNSQSIANRLGKMLRLNKSPTNPIPGDNPASIDGIAGTTTGDNRAIWAAGLRNPFTFSFHPTTGRMHINDVGGGTYEEINLGAAGANFGWPNTEGPFNQASFPDFAHPLAAYPRPGSGNPNYPAGLEYGGRAITGGTFYIAANQTFPASYAGDYFFADYVDDWIRRFDYNSNQVFDFAENANSPVDLKVGSDGALYYLARGTGRVMRVQYDLAGCDADIAPPGGDGQVTVSDVVAVISAFDLPCDQCAEDIVPPPPNGDGQVTVADVTAVLAAFGPCD